MAGITRGRRKGSLYKESASRENHRTRMDLNQSTFINTPMLEEDTQMEFSVDQAAFQAVNLDCELSLSDFQVPQLVLSFL